MKSYDWLVIGGGIAGISIAEILTREGFSVALIEKNKKLASVATREFHEWVHTGSLYTLVKDEMMTLKYILGSLDDLLEFYSSFENMNLAPAENGLKIKNSNYAWFNQNYINFKYRLKNRKLIFPWIYAVARSIALIEGIKNHDWLRRRAGILESVTSKYYMPIIKNIFKILSHKDKFFQIASSDFTTNSRSLLRDLVTTSIKNGLDIHVDNELLEIKNSGKDITAQCSKATFNGKNVAICLGGNIEKFTNIKIKKTYAPIAVVKNIEKNTSSFVELDYFKKNCINIITKDSSIGMIGGISLSNMNEAENYFNYMIAEHKKVNSRMEILKKYIGIKNEIISKKENRNYLFHINQSNDNENIWSIIPGKFTLAFSLAPEFFRKVYKRNPKKFFQTYADNNQYSDIVDHTVWEEFSKKEKE